MTSRALLASGAEAKLEGELFGRAKRAPGTPPAGRVALLPREPAAARAQFPQLEGSHPQPWAGFTTNIGAASADLGDLKRRVQRGVNVQLARHGSRLAGGRAREDAT